MYIFSYVSHLKIQKANGRQLTGNVFELTNQDWGCNSLNQKHKFFGGNVTVAVCAAADTSSHTDLPTAVLHKCQRMLKAHQISSGI